MTTRLRFSSEARESLKRLKTASPSVHAQVQKALGYLETNPRHASLKTHRYASLSGPNKEQVFEAYAQNNTPGAYRVFFWYGPDEVDDKKKRVPVISVLAITPHP